MNLGLCLGVTAPGGGGGTPADPPSVVDSATGTGAAGTVTSASLTATGSNRYVLAKVGAGTSDTITAMAATITGAGGTVSMTQIYFEETTGSNLENFAAFGIAEASLPGAGPYTITGTATGSNVPDKLGVVAVSIQDAPNAPTHTVASGANVDTGTITPTAADSLVIAAHGTSTVSLSSDLPGTTVLETLDYGDTIIVGWAQRGASAFSVTDPVKGRDVFGMFAFAPS